MSTLKENILACDKNVPRYTSYPTAPHFKNTQDTKVVEKWIGDIKAGDQISLYIHLPFCPKLCWYCGCHTKITQKYAPIEKYLSLLRQEIDLLSAKLNQTSKISHLHFGGGSPGMMVAADFDKLMTHLKERFEFSEHAEVAIEMDPRNVSEARVGAYAKHGVNRISLGIQDFNDKVLASVNRQQPFYLSENAVNLFREYGIDQFNFDLMYGLPYQTTETILDTIQTALFLEPDRISFFGYAHVPWMKKHMRLIQEKALPDNDLRYDLFETGASLLEERGLQAIGIDHFARENDPMIKALKDGTLKRNFQGYTTDQAENLVGLGVSSISKYKNGFAQNAADIPTYKAALEEERLPIQKTYTMSDEDHIRADIIERLMCDFELDLSLITDKYRLDRNRFSSEIQNLKTYEELGFLTIYNHSMICLNKSARPAARLICSVFDEYFQASQNIQRHAKAI